VLRMPLLHRLLLLRHLRRITHSTRTALRLIRMRIVRSIRILPLLLLLLCLWLLRRASAALLWHLRWHGRNLRGRHISGSRRHAVLPRIRIERGRTRHIERRGIRTQCARPLCFGVHHLLCFDPRCHFAVQREEFVTLLIALMEKLDKDSGPR